MAHASGIYQIRHVASGRVYVGSAVNIEKRWRDHRRQLAAGKHHSRKLQRAWIKYGAGAFQFEVVDPNVPKPSLTQREQHWIDRLSAFGDGFNMRPRADSMLGHKKSREAIEATRRAHVGRKQSAAERRRRSEAQQARPPILKAITASKKSDSLRAMHAARSEEARTRCGQRISNALRGRPVSDVTRMRIASKLEGRVLPKAHVEAIRQACGKLSDCQRQDVVRRRQSGESFHSIGRDLGVTHEAVRKVFAMETRVLP